MAVFTLLSKTKHRTSETSEQVVAYPSTDTNSQEKIAIERHGNQHEDVAQPHLNHLQERLYDVQR